MMKSKIGRGRKGFSIGRLAAAGLPWLGFWVLLLSAMVYASHDPSHPFPHATVKVWDTVFPIGGVSLGLTPGESVEDPTGLTGHGTSFPTIVTVYANGSHPLGPSGLSYWNPDGSIFAWYGKTIGYPAGVDINRGGPAQPAESSVCGSFSFGPGDVWVAGQQNELLYAHVAGTDCFRTYGTDRIGGIDFPRDKAWGIEVDERTGLVFFAAPQSGRIVRLDPPTADNVIWGVGGSPAYVTVDGGGLPYTTLSDSDAILRVDPGVDGLLGNMDDTATFWRVPNVNGISPSFRPVPDPLLLEEENPDSIIIADADGNIWFAETNSNEIGRLSGGPDGLLGTADDVICEFTKEGLLNPQQIASTGSGSTLQVYFTEGDGNSVSVLTAAEADLAAAPTRVCTTVPAGQLLGVFARSGTTVFFDEEVPPLQTAIVPTIHDVPGLDGSASGTTTTANGEPIPPILRFSPMPNPVLSANGSPVGDAGNGFPSGMTGVYAASRIAGAYLRGNKHFEVQSGAIIGLPPPPPAGLPGRMTGGGRLFTADGTRVTHGFVLQCTVAAGDDDRNALQVNWGDGNRFHLTSLTSASCSDDPAIDPGPSDPGEPPAPFDTHSGTGVGRYNGMDGATVEWTFGDAGEPGRNDRGRMVIRNAQSLVVLEVDGMLDGGNYQAHAPNP